MLSEEERKKIKDEEIFRQEIQRELEAQKPTPSRKKKAWQFINSSFGLWLLSTVIVGLFGWAYTTCQTQEREQAQRKEQQRRLNLEIKNRVTDTLSYLQDMERRVNEGKAKFPPEWLFARTVRRLDGFDESESQLQSIYPDNKERDLKSLIFELETLLASSKKEELNRALSAYEQLKSKASEAIQTSTFGNPVSAEEKQQSLDSVKQVKAIIEEGFQSSDWKQ